jgi:DMSO/TMAO reductase YedYZ molybdopterin-dependent catalytic subunit
VRPPPGQIETTRFPLVGERSPSPELSDPTSWILEVGGLVENPFTLTLPGYMALHHQKLEFDIHCVTSWSREGSRWSGVPLSVLFDEARPQSRGAFVSFSAYSSRDHHTSLPLAVAKSSSWLVHEFDGESLTSEHGGPVRVVTPGKYFYKSLKWVRSIEVLSEDRLGWWEVNSSYHNNADPWAGDQRFTSGSIRPEQADRFLEAANYDKYRGKVLLGLDLRRWRPSSSDLRRLYLKNCDLRGVDLGSVDLRECNLSLSNLSGANLAGADLSGSDLEGADFTDANLTDADLSASALSATRFEGAAADGATFEGSWGLVENQYRLLSVQGVLALPVND